jgi:hypothetical protein
MATYGDSAREYPYGVQRRKKQKYSLYTRVIDFTNNLPVTQGSWDADIGSMKGTTAWAAGDVLQTVRIRSGQTVLGVQVEILTRSADSGDSITIGYGNDTDRWGRFKLNDSTGVKDTRTDAAQIADYFYEPTYFSSADTIDIIINKAALQGKIRLIVHLLEDDR